MINSRFVAVKVDREERPDVDAVYMTATQALTGQGGWPMSVFLTPDRRPFYAGTYFPPTPRHGLPSFQEVLKAVSIAWSERRSEVLTSANAIESELAGRRLDLPAYALTDDDCRTAVEQLARDFDAVHGGFGGAPKFPPSMVLEALLRYGDEDGDHSAPRMAAQTLEAMARGGIYDQLAGGFARYSVDSRWVVPHFEKMLYDNALLLGVYVHWWRLTGHELAERVVEETVEWLLTEMRSADGGFTASLDADSLDSDGHLTEGAFYAWSPDQLTEVLGPDDGQWAAEVCSVTSEGTFEHGLSTLQRRTDADPERWARVRSSLRTAREHRARPGRDDKIVAAWNGWLLESLVQAGVVCHRPEWIEAAVEAAELLWRVHWVDGRLRRTSRDGTAGTAAGTLEDYAAVALGFTRLAAATADPVWIERAEQLLSVVEAEFADGAGGFYDTAADAEALYTRPKDPTDNATPSGLSTAVHAFALLAELTGRGDLRRAGRGGRAQRRGSGASGPALRRLAAGQRGDPTPPPAGPGRRRGRRRRSSDEPNSQAPPVEQLRRARSSWRGNPTSPACRCWPTVRSSRADPPRTSVAASSAASPSLTSTPSWPNSPDAVAFRIRPSPSHVARVRRRSSICRSSHAYEPERRRASPWG